MSKLAVITGAWIRCAAGSAPSQLVANNNAIRVDGQVVAAIQDHLPNIHVKPFGTCALLGGPCTPVTPVTWWPGETTVLLGGMFPVLDTESILGCAVGGIIRVETPGQVFVHVDDERLKFKGDDDPPGFLFSLIPVIGPAAVAGYASGKGQKGAMWLNLGLAALDAASLGSAALARAGITAGGRGLAASARSLFGGAGRKLAAARAAATAARLFGRAATASRWMRAYGARAMPREMYALASRRAERFKEALRRHDGSFQRMRRALLNENSSLLFGPNRAVTVRRNARAGRVRELQVAKELRKEGHEILASQVSVKTSRSRRVIDHLIRDKDTGQVRAIEVKSGKASRTRSQKAKDRAMETEGGELVGKNAPTMPEAMRGVRIKIPTEVRR